MVIFIRREIVAVGQFSRVPCVDKLEALTGFRPRTPLTEIIDRVAAFFQQKTETVAAPRAAANSAV